MSGQSSIEWTDATWNPVTGCDRVSPGCAHCYALDMAARLKRMGQPKYQRDGDPKTSGPGFGVTLHEGELDAPVRWRKPRMVFVNSMSDLFHKQVPDEFIRRVFYSMGACRKHTFQVLTKRPERMRDFMAQRYPETVALGDEGVVPLPNVWLGTSIENRRFVGRADALRDTPAAVRFISAEPLLGPLLYDAGDMGIEESPEYTNWSDRQDATPSPELDLHGIDWLIVGGESGPDHRPIRAEWVRPLRDRAKSEGTAFFFKQWGGRTTKVGGRELDGRTWDEMPLVNDYRYWRVA